MPLRPASRLALWGVAGVLSGCGADGPPVQTRGSAAIQTLAAAADTFINSKVPDNNDGASPSLYTGENGQGGLMRALLRFDLPPAWSGRVTVSRVVLTMVTRGTGTADATPPTAGTESLQAVTVGWQEGTGFGDATTQNTVGQPCGTSGATWNQPDCAGGTPWTGGTVAATVSATATVPATSEAPVAWDSDAPGNAGLLADVQSWIDAPATNHGWRIASSTEGTMGNAQRFHAREEPGKGPVLAVTTACDPDFNEVDGGCAPAGGGNAGSPMPPDGAAGGPKGASGGSGCSCALWGRAPGPAEAAGCFLMVGLTAALRRRRSRRR